MNEKLAKAIRKGTKRSGREYVDLLCGYTFGQKCSFFWYILTHKKAT